MRVWITVAFAGAALAGLSGCGKPAPKPGPLAVADMPQRKAGLWRQTVAVAGANTTMPETQSCSDALSESKLNLLGEHKSKDLCQRQDFTQNADGTIGFSVSCDFGKRGLTVNTGTISGDFNARYQIAMDSKTTGADMALRNGEHKFTITMVRTGPCRPGQRGGDMILADGRKVNLTDPKPGPRYR